MNTSALNKMVLEGCFLASFIVAMTVFGGCSESQGPPVQGSSKPFTLQYVVAGGFAGGTSKHLVVTTAINDGKVPGAEIYVVPEDVAEDILHLLKVCGFSKWESQSPGAWADLFEYQLAVESASLNHSVVVFDIPEGDSGDLHRLQELASEIEEMARSRGHLK